MTPEAQRIAIAETYRWKKVYKGTKPDNRWIQPDGLHYATTDEIPDYLNDLNTAEPLCQKMHEAGWKVGLTPRYCLWYVYASHQMLGDFEIENTSLAAAICEAFLRTLGLWTDTKGS
jgi:hypothetical protein